MALITSDRDAMRFPSIQMALITSDRDAMRSPQAFKRPAITSG